MTDSLPSFDHIDTGSFTEDPDRDALFNLNTHDWEITQDHYLNLLQLAEGGIPEEKHADADGNGSASNAFDFPSVKPDFGRSSAAAAAQVGEHEHEHASESIPSRLFREASTFSSRIVNDLQNGFSFVTSSMKRTRSEEAEAQERAEDGDGDEKEKEKESTAVHQTVDLAPRVSIRPRAALPSATHTHSTSTDEYGELVVLDRPAPDHHIVVYKLLLNKPFFRLRYHGPLEHTPAKTMLKYVASLWDGDSLVCATGSGPVIECGEEEGKAGVPVIFRKMKINVTSRKQTFHIIFQAFMQHDTELSHPVAESEAQPVIILSHTTQREPLFIEFLGGKLWQRAGGGTTDYATVSWQSLAPLLRESFEKETKASRTLNDDDMENLFVIATGFETVAGGSGPMSKRAKLKSGKTPLKKTLTRSTFFQFWNWFFYVMRLVEKKEFDLWNIVSPAFMINGFISREQSRALLSSDDIPVGTFVTRFSTSHAGWTAFAYKAAGGAVRDMLVRPKDLTQDRTVAHIIRQTNVLRFVWNEDGCPTKEEVLGTIGEPVKREGKADPDGYFYVPS